MGESGDITSEGEGDRVTWQVVTGGFAREVVMGVGGGGDNLERVPY